MRINEIIEGLVQPKRTTSKPLDHPYDLDKLYADYLSKHGSGKYSYGTPNERPEEYNVTTHLPSRIKLDAKYIWINTIEPYMGSNPYLPVYYNIKKHPDSEGRIRLEYRMKKYYSINDIENLYGELTNDIRNNKKRLNNQIIVMVRHALDDPNWLPSKSSAFAEFVTICEKMVTSRMRIVGNPEFVKAITLIKNLIDNNPKLSEDIHRDNIMLDLTPYGLIPVFTDPIKDDGSSIIHVYNPDP